MNIRVLLVSVLCGLGMSGSAYGMEKDPDFRNSLYEKLERNILAFLRGEGIDIQNCSYTMVSNCYKNPKSASIILFVGAGSPEAKAETDKDITFYHQSADPSYPFMDKMALFKVHELALSTAALLSIGAAAGALIAYCCMGKTSEQPEPATDNKKK